jgi:hypothetical protein
VSLYGATYDASAQSPGNLFQANGSTGAIGWSQPIAGVGVSLTVATDAGGNIYLASGDDTTLIDIDSGPGTAYVSSTPSTNSGSGYYITKLDPSGNFLAARQTGPTAASALQVDGAGNIYTAGIFSGSGIFDTGSGYATVPETHSQGTPLFVCKTTQATGNLFGQVFNDLNANGTFDPSSRETYLQGATVYVDLNNNAVLDPGEPSTLTGSLGQYEFDHLLPGNYMVRQFLPSGWAQTTPSGNAGLSAAVAAGMSIDSQLFGTNIPNHTATYTNNTAEKTSKGKPNAISTLTISDTYTIFDLNLTFNVSNTKNTLLTVRLTGPDGRSVTLVARTSINGTMTFETSAFDYKRVKGTWTLEVDGLSGGTLSSWSLSINESNS